MFFQNIRHKFPYILIHILFYTLKYFIQIKINKKTSTGKRVEAFIFVIFDKKHHYEIVRLHKEYFSFSAIIQKI